MSALSQKRHSRWQAIAVALLLHLCIAPSLAEESTEQVVSPDGAQIFADRCVLCHGNYGAGDGFMPLVIKGYPQTNLLLGKNDSHFTVLEEKVKWGGALGDMNHRSPPWIDELSEADMEAVTQFVVKLRENPEQTWQALEKHLANKPVSVETGRLVFQTRCAGCHGVTGLGDGPLSAIVKSPPPTNLVKSRLPALAMKQIISNGGANVGRSVQMPGWKHELTPVQIDSVTQYVELLRD